MQNQCVYCWDSSKNASEYDMDHVIARQFFPNEYVFRNGLPKVPSCVSCNKEKQRLEDVLAAILQFGHDSDASRRVMEDRLPRTFEKNARLQRDIRNSFIEVELNGSKRLAIDLSGQTEYMKKIFIWAKYVFKGLYWHLTQGPDFNMDLEMLLLYPRREENKALLWQQMRGFGDFQEKTFGDGEFKLFSSIDLLTPIAFLHFDFKSIRLFCTIFRKIDSHSICEIYANIKYGNSFALNQPID